MEPRDQEPAKTARLPPKGSGQGPVRERLALNSLVTDGGTQVRSEISDETVDRYAEALGREERFPPVVVFRDKGTDVLADGFHRVRAYQKAGRSEIEADVYQGGRDEALWFALGANRAHGQGLSGDDKRRAIEIAYKAWPDVSQVQIAKQVGCAQQYVGRIRAQLTTSGKLPDRVVGRDGRERPATRPSRTRQPAGAENQAAPATENQGPDKRSDSPQGANTAGQSEGADTRGERPGQGPGESANDEKTGADATEPTGERSGTGVTAKQSARDRSNRIVSVVADDAKHLTAQECLIDFTALDREQMPKWIEELEEARRMLARFIRRLRKEVQSEA